MIKNIIAPVQTWLLSQKRCVGCGASLKGATQKINKKTNSCKCGRIYILDSKTKTYRRAKLNEI